jgi:spore coat polysaccharide biosynthesis predicted glycosyltransferase SpsG/L-amino acid N-acyltransferase YncA
LLFRADAQKGQGQGPGHVLRGLALAQAWQDAGGAATFVMAADAFRTSPRLQAQDVTTIAIAVMPGSSEDARQTAELAAAERAAWVILDGPQFGGSYQCVLREAGHRVLVVADQMDAEEHVADFLLNEAPGVDESDYPRRARHTRFLLGPRYVLLRREFLRWRRLARKIPPCARNVLVALGDNDSEDVALTVVEALGHIDAELEVVVVATPWHRHYAALEQAVRAAPITMRLRPNLTDMPGLLAWADVAVCDSGLAAWERVFLGLPALYLPMCEPQEFLARQLAAGGLGNTLPLHPRPTVDRMRYAIDHLIRSPQQRKVILDASREVVDGEGCQRVCMYLRGDPIRLRWTTMRDCETLWRWTNDPQSRRNSFTDGPISWDEHVRWLENKLHDPRTCAFIGVDADDRLVGRLRFEGTGERTQVSVAVDAEQRGKGYGRRIVVQGLAYVFRNMPVQEVHALIKPANQPSIRLFESLGFQLADVEQIGSNSACHYVLKKSDVLGRGPLHPLNFRS